MTATTTLANRLWPEASLLRAAVLAIAGSLLVAAAAQVSIPMWPVPMTLQTLAVLGLGAAYGARLGAATLGLYALEGAIGLPFFASGQAGLFKDGFIISSGGYIIGFILAAWLVGRLVESGWGRNLGGMALATLIGGAALYIPGLIWLAAWFAGVKGMEAGPAMSAAITWGFTPFLVGDVIKALIAGLGIGGFARLRS